jgi:hypothetical protein
MKLIDLNLPEFMWMDGCEHDTPTTGRNIICHVRSMTVVEVFEKDNVLLKDGLVTYDFDHLDTMGIVEHFTMAVHYSATLDDDIAMLRSIMAKCAKWYTDWMDWEDGNIRNEEIAGWN